jgi:phospholipase C
VDGDRPGFGRRRQPVLVEVADAYGGDHRVQVRDAAEITVDTRHSGGWYDLALSSPSDAAFSYQLAGRLELPARLTSDPQLGRS